MSIKRFGWISVHNYVVLDKSRELIDDGRTILVLFFVTNTLCLFEESWKCTHLLIYVMTIRTIGINDEQKQG